MSLDDAYCADGCGRLAETERPTADGRNEMVCSDHATIPLEALEAAACGMSCFPGIYYIPQTSDDPIYDKLAAAALAAALPHLRPLLGEHSSNPREDG